MKPSTKKFTFRTAQVLDTMLGLARERLSAAVEAADTGDLAGAADELRAASDLARQAGSGAFCLAASLDATLDAKRVRK